MTLGIGSAGSLFLELSLELHVVFIADIPVHFCLLQDHGMKLVMFIATRCLFLESFLLLVVLDLLSLDLQQILLSLRFQHLAPLFFSILLFLPGL